MSNHDLCICGAPMFNNICSDFCENYAMPKKGNVAFATTEDRDAFIDSRPEFKERKCSNTPGFYKLPRKGFLCVFFTQVKWEVR